MDLSKAYFPGSYLESRDWFHQQLEQIRRFWPSSDLKRYALSVDPELTIDWIEAPCPSPEARILIVSTGLHGTEGFTGTAVLHHLLRAYLDKLDHAHMGLLLVHAANPWGMHYRRRTNAFNVDLNRNFRFGRGPQTAFENPGYLALRTMLHTERPLGNLSLQTIRFIGSAVGQIISKGIARIKEATLLGQLDDPLGLYFAGREIQEESQVVWDLLTERITRHGQIVHLDIHTGYGVRREMSLVNSVREGIPPELWAQRFNYPHIVRADPEAFYAMQGDMIDAFYDWTCENVPHHRYFGTAFEFGTLGASLLAQMRSLRAMVFENQATQHGVASPEIAQVVRREFKELFDPGSSKWREAAILKCDQALAGILKDFGFLQSM